MGGKDLKYTDYSVEKLILAVQSKPPLYNFILREYHNKDLADKLWDEVATEVNAPVIDCRRKWSILRNTYARHLREIRKPTGKGGMQRKQWYLSDLMSFLREYVGHHRKVNSNVAGDEEQGCSMDDDSVSESGGEHLEEIYIKEENEPESATSQQLQEKKIKKMKTSTQELVANPMIEFLEAGNQLAEDSEHENPHLLFFKSLLPDFQKLSQRRQRKFKEEILSTLNKYLDEEENYTQ